MRSRYFFPFGIIILVFTLISFSIQSTKEPWRKDQVMDPAELAKIINDPSAKKPVIFNIGPSGKIKGSIEMGPAQEKENLNNLKIVLNKLPRQAQVVIYCGCCPFEHCPNIRPAFQLLNEMKFTDPKLLNLSHNLKVDWIDKGYPMEKKSK